EQMFNALTEVLVRGPNADEERFRMDFLAEARRWLSELENDGISSGDERSPAAHWMIGVMRAARRNGFQIPTGILAMYRSLLTAETVATTISADADLQGAGRDFFRRYAWEDVIRSVQPAQLEEFALTIASLLKDSPAQLHRVITDMAEGHFTVNTNASEDPRLEQARNRRARLLTASILTIGVAMLAGSSSLPQPFGIPLSKVLYAILGILYAVIIFQWRKLR
ncbi:MAG TPA: hypothetical protein VGS58_13620, partial [Candidatus Sulfopaludibacter sp.]|nr:hypothetical protein [Candidatus Sulfopaludibacter sp.]